MKVPVSWLRDYVSLPHDVTTIQIADALTRAGLEVVAIEAGAAELSGPIVVARVVDFVEEPQKNGKTIRWCRVDCGTHNPEGQDHRGIICGAQNFHVGDLVVASLPGAELPGGFQISARKTYGHVSDGMLCAVDELGIGEDHTGILVLDPVSLPPSTQLGDDAVAALGLRDEVLDIELTPDLGYCLSLRGVAREVAQAFGLHFTDPVVLPTPKSTEGGYPVRLESDRCPLFVAASVDGIDPNAPTPPEIARRLVQCGMRSISLAVDLTNYVMLEIGQPLHAYDADKLSGAIVVRQAKPGEKIVTLDDVERELDPDDLVITDESGPIGIAGVMGGASSEITDSTSNVVIEGAHFDARSTARSSRRHNLSSEASKRFERGVDPAAAYAAAHRVADLLARYGGGRVQAQETVAGQVPPSSQQHLVGDLPARVLGADVSTADVIQVLSASGVSVTAMGDSLTVVPPSWRPDLRDPHDYVEEVGRKIGLDTIAPRVPRSGAGKGRTPAQRLRRQLAHTMADVGFVEVMTLPFVSEGLFDQLGYHAEDRRRRAVRVHNPLTDEQPLLRTSLLAGLADAARRNIGRACDDVALFEIGRVFIHTQESGKTAAPMPGVDSRPDGDALRTFAVSLPDQPRHVAGLLAGNWLPASWQHPAEAASWTQAVAAALRAAGTYGLQPQRRAAEYAPYHPGRCAELFVGSHVLGYAGELHPAVVKAMELPARASAFELDLETLLALATDIGQIGALSAHPVVKEDVALVVGSDVPAADVERALRDGAGELLESLALFDVYEGEQAGEGKKSLAYALRFRAPDRTLKQAEVTAARDSAVNAAKERCGAILRA